MSSYGEPSPEPSSIAPSGKPRPPVYAHPSSPARPDSGPVAVCAGCSSSTVRMGGAVMVGQPVSGQPGQNPIFFFSPAQPTVMYPSRHHGVPMPDQTVYAAAQPMVVTTTTSDPLHLRDQPALVSCQKCGTTGYSVLRSVPSVTTQ
ncbi:hypothetical protein JCM1841_005993 [Sporobolomyces salmonicolor]